MSPLLIFVLVLLFLVGGLLVLRDTAFFRSKKPLTTAQRRARRDHRQHDGSGSAVAVEGSAASRRGDREYDSANRHDDGGSDGSSGDGGGGDGGGGD